MLSLTPRRLFVTVLVLAATLALLGVIVDYNAYESAVAKAEAASRAFATVLDEEARHSLENVDQQLRVLFHLATEHFDGRRIDEELDRIIHTAADRSGFVRRVLVVDASGRLLYGDDEDRPIASLGALLDEEGSSEASFSIGSPTRSVPDGSWELPISHGFRDDAGRLLGVAVAFLDLDVFERSYARLDLGPGSAVVVARNDGRLLWRHPLVDFDNLAYSRRAPPWPGAFDPGRSGNYQLASPVDHLQRISAYIVDAHVPITVVVSLPRSAALADWRRSATFTAAVDSLLILCLVLLGWRLQKEMAARARSFADLERQATALASKSLQLDMARHTAQETEERLRTALDALGEGFLLWDAEDRLVLCNAAAFRLPPDPQFPLRLGMHFIELVRNRVERGLVPAAIGREEAYCLESVARHRDPKGPIEVSIADGQIIRIVERRTNDGGIVTLQTDVTAERQLERALIDARQQAEAASHAKSEFLASMSHELRTPLNAVIGFAELIHEQMLGTDADAQARYRNYAGDIRDSGGHLLGLINDILDFAKSEAGSLQLMEDQVDVPEIVASAIRMLKPRAERSGIRLIADLAPDLPPVSADGMRVRQILLNLISNAIKYTPVDGQVSVTVARSGEALVLKVIDTGIGIAAEHLSAVLEPFRQIENDINRRYRGTGLGLPLTKRLVELHHGVLELESSIGRGTTATVRLPAILCAEPVQQTAAG